MKHVKASTSFSMSFAFPTGPSLVCLILHARVFDGGGHVEAQTRPFFPLNVL